MKFLDEYTYPLYVYKKMLQNQMDATAKSFEESGASFWCPSAWKKAFADAYAAGMQTFDDYDAWEEFLSKL